MRLNHYKVKNGASLSYDVVINYGLRCPYTRRDLNFPDSLNILEKDIGVYCESSDELIIIRIFFPVDTLSDWNDREFVIVENGDTHLPYNAFPDVSGKEEYTREADDMIAERYDSFMNSIGIFERV